MNEEKIKVRIEQNNSYIILLKKIDKSDSRMKLVKYSL